MGKTILYKFLSCEVNCGTEEVPDVKQIFLDKSLNWNEANEKIAKEEAYNGEYTIEDDGTSDPDITTDDVLNSLLGVTVR